MHCDRAEEFFSDYLERTLDRPMTVALESHLAGCAGCRDQIEALQATFYALDAVPAVEPPADGAWRVMSRLRGERAARLEAERRRAPAFADWLRSLNPLSVGMGASLATLVIGGTLVFSGITRQHHEQWTLLPRPALPAPVTAADLPAVQVAYAAGSAAVQPVDLQVVPAVDLPDGQVQLSGGGLPTSQSSGSFRAGTPVPFRLQLPRGGEPQTVHLQVRSPRLEREHRLLVVIPLGSRAQSPATLIFSDLPLEEGLRRLAPYLDRPVVVEGQAAGAVSLRVQDQAPVSCLRELAGQLGLVLRDDAVNGTYRLSLPR